MGHATPKRFQKKSATENEKRKADAKKKSLPWGMPPPSAFKKKGGERPIETEKRKGKETLQKHVSERFLLWLPCVYGANMQHQGT